MSRNVSLTLQNTGDSRSIVEAIMADNATALVREFPSMTKIDCPDKLVIRAGSVAARIGRPWDVQEIHLAVISLSGTVDEEDNQFTLFWK